MIKLYELVGSDDRRFSPYCWRSLFALTHKGFEVERIAVKFTDKDIIAFSGQELVPIIQDGTITVHDSWAIACYLEDTYPERPPLFGSSLSRSHARFINLWADLSMNLSIFPLVIQDIFDHVHPEDREYFLKTRGPRFDRSFAEIQKDRDMAVGQMRKGFAPLRAILEEQNFLCGVTPAYADYIVFGGFQWVRSVSPYSLVPNDDPIFEWCERMLSLFDDLGRRAVGYEG